MTIQVAHDFTCPWCWIAFGQTVRLHERYGVDFDWAGYELWPEGLQHPPSPAAVNDPNRPKVPSRLELAYWASDAQKPRTVPKTDEIHNALEAVEHAKPLMVGQQLVARLYNALWMEGRPIHNVDELVRQAEGIVPDLDAFERDIVERANAHKIVSFDEQAYSLGVYNVPTFFIAGKKYAEQPYPVLARAIEAAMK